MDDSQHAPASRPDDPHQAEVSVLFVCMGNICRSPMAEAVFRHQLAAAGIAGRVHVDSAGTHSYHLDHEPHPETTAELTRRGVEVGAQRSRLVTPGDLQAFDLVIAMDRANLRELEELARPAGGHDAVHAEISLLLDHASGDGPTARGEEGEVPDPYYVGGYDRVYELVDFGARGLLHAVRARLAA